MTAEKDQRQAFSALVRSDQKLAQLVIESLSEDDPRRHEYHSELLAAQKAMKGKRK